MRSAEIFPIALLKYDCPSTRFSAVGIDKDHVYLLDFVAVMNLTKPARQGALHMSVQCLLLGTCFIYALEWHNSRGRRLPSP
jgi:hypothetical protein